MLSHLAECCSIPARVMTIEESHRGGQVPIGGGQVSVGRTGVHGGQMSVGGQVSIGRRTGVRRAQMSTDVQEQAPLGRVWGVCGSGTQRRDRG